MAEEQTTSSDVSATQQSSDPPATGTPAQPSATPKQEQANLTPEEWQKRIDDLERKYQNADEERKRHRSKLTEYEKREQEANDAQLSEIERVKTQHSRLQQEHENLVREMQELRVRQAVERNATRLQFIRPEVATRLMDWSQLEYNEDGTPKNVDALLERLAHEMPELVRPAQTAQETTEPPAQQQRATPALPAMNPGRSQIAQPGTNPPGKPVSLADAYRTTYPRGQ